VAVLDRHDDAFPTLAAIRPPRVMVAVAWILLAASIAVAVFLVTVPWVQTTSGPGVVTALNPNDRMQEIDTLVSGRIQEWFVRDGSEVRTGDPIVRIVDNDPQLLERLQAERGQVAARLDAAEAAARTAEIDLRRTQELFEGGLAASREVEQARIRFEERRAAVADAAAALSRVDVSLSRQSVQVVRAPRDGVILRVDAGDTATVVDAGQRVATFVPAGVERAVELFVDGRDVALVRPGAAVRLQFEGWPAVQFSGWPSIAVGTFDAEVVAVDPSAQADGRFRVLVTEPDVAGTPWPDERFVRFGARARGWILLETVPVGYELWRQLNNFPPNYPVGGGPGSSGSGSGFGGGG
jgi:RND family efflux transporter MFP subunit